MNSRYCLALTVVVIMIGTGMMMAQETLKPPVAKKEPKVLKIHGYTITDNYAWLRDRETPKKPEIVKYLEDENAYTEAHMGKHKAFVDSLYKEMLGRIKQTDLSVPYKLADYWYLTKTEEGKQ